MAQEVVNLEVLLAKIKAKGISLGKLSTLSGISKPMLSLMFNRKRNMSVNKLNKILEVCELTLENISQN